MQNSRDIHDYVDIYLEPLVAVITFMLGYLLSRIISQYEEKRRLNNLYSFFKAYLIEQKKGVNKQLVSFAEYTDALKEMKNTVGPGTIIVTQPFSVLESINKEELYKALLKKNINPEVLISFLIFVDYFKAEMTAHMEHQRYFIQDYLTEVRDKWNLHIIEFHDLKATLCDDRLKVSSSQDLLYLNTVYNKWNNSKDLEATMTSVVKPLLEYFIPKYNEDPGNLVSMRVIRVLQKIELMYKQWTILKETQIRESEKVYMRFKGHSKKILKELEVIK